ncbi:MULTISPECIES: glycine betaine ABC transporter substrate-binding protein [unclassified Methanosarcina]|uniref:glycine betaine ABC transporter substrate-binding protein n=1 Tax=unclassified Methanosarcina TaxID=2644672 RepID=UPI000615707F|nr:MULTISPECIES: glycine betaine ABC transporter substrate-binding protein [unclassified Methanosarcina]AKB18433.1 Glycine betaine ABC transport system, glycine betaine-binding protein OpuAC [Methanosarcina sp. WWM596]AKB22015.1 Glycine betaine ABC transport system, glycine betaine-binding protein OpuAC [Methanosarcina sp. WH1]
MTSKKLNPERKKIGSILTIVLIIGLTLFAAGCAEQGDEAVEGAEVSEVAELSEPVKIGYVLWDGEIASTNVMQQVLEQAGYEDVEIIAVDVGPLYQGLADEQFDFTTSAWLPYTHQTYWETYGNRLDSVHTNLEDCRIGLVVPSYVTINSIEELNSEKDKFDGKIIGIDPGAGIMQVSEDAISEYGLDMELVSGSSAAMTASLKKAIDSEEWVVVTLWSPHWSFNRWDLKYLDDPKGVYGEADHVETLARLGLKEDKPNLYGILTRFQWTHNDIQAVMVDIENGMAPEEAAANWVKSNPEKVNEWIGEK